jgi:hypothetical protein
MKQTTKAVIATSAIACATLFSFSWSEQRGVSLSVEDAHARVGRPLTPVRVAGVARRHNRRAAYGYGGYGYGVAGAAAVGTAAAVAGSPYYAGTGWGCNAGDPFCTRPGVVGARAAYYGGMGDPNYRPGVWGARAAYYGAAPAASTPAWSVVTAYRAGGPWYGYSGWDDYRARNGIVCTPGTWIKAADGVQYPCQ